jgi:hypothetical protein
MLGTNAFLLLISAAVCTNDCITAEHLQGTVVASWHSSTRNFRFNERHGTSRIVR